VVLPNYAVTNCQCEQVVDVAGSNHITVNKPDSPTSNFFQTFITQVTRFTKIAPSIYKSNGLYSFSNEMLWIANTSIEQKLSLWS